jgi:hypothetical protein
MVRGQLYVVAKLRESRRNEYSILVPSCEMENIFAFVLSARISRRRHTEFTVKYRNFLILEMLLFDVP